MHIAPGTEGLHHQRGRGIPVRILAPLAALLLFFFTVAPASLSGQTSPPGLRLVVLIAIDQFRYDFLTRFRKEYTGGFARLLTRGAVFTNANVEHYPTFTAPGHATMLTGAIPAVSGIVSNEWYDRESGKILTSVSDAGVTQLGAPTGVAASPRRLLVSTVGDEMVLAAGLPKGSPDAPRIFGVSLKDRSAILPAGHAATAAYWWDLKSGKFVSSTYYFPQLPDWVRAFNDRNLADAFAGKRWTMLGHPSSMLRQIPTAEGENRYKAIEGSPFGNDLLLDFTIELIERERIGRHAATDLLSVSFSAPDLVGHAYGPESPQMTDIAIRMDQTIGQLLDRIDRTVGLDRTLVAFTSDHGGALLPESLRTHGLPGGRLPTKTLFDAIQQALTAAFGEGQWVLAPTGSAPYLNYALIESMRLDPARVRAVAADAVRAVPHVAHVYTRDQLLLGQVPPDRFSRRVLRGFNAQQSGDLEIVLDPYWITLARGGLHGSPYNYDSHIPLILMGPRIRPGQYADAAALNDLAPTLSTLVGVEIPSGSVGRVLTEAIQPAPAAPARAPRRRAR